MSRKRDISVYSLLLAGWILILAWQVVEHRRVVSSARNGLLTHARDISTSLSVVIRSQSRYRAVPRKGLEAALQALANTDELQAVALVSPIGQTVVSAGAPLDPEVGLMPPGTADWKQRSLTFIDFVQLGPTTADRTEPDPGVVIEDRWPAGRGFRGPRPAPDDRTSPTGPARSSVSDEDRGPDSGNPPVPVPRPDPAGKPGPAPPPPIGPGSDGDQRRDETGRLGRGRGPEAGEVGGEEAATRERSRRERRRGSRRWGPEMLRRARAWWSQRYPGEAPPSRLMTAEEFSELFEKEGIHKFVLLLSADPVAEATRRDLWLRLALSAAALTAASALGAGWHGARRTAELELRLVRAQEMNTHLRELNIAAAGLAHETRNPLNVVRGLAQLIAQRPTAQTDGPGHAQTIVEEVDRVTSRLNEFIAYSRPCSPVLAPTDLTAIIRDVGRTLGPDREEKNLAFSVEGDEQSVIADEGLLRQMLFNLVLNAYQAVGNDKGIVTVTIGRSGAEVSFRVTDNGPGVPEDAREDIFRPYFTLKDHGTGLGLAVVRQIVLAHHWEISQRDLPGGGAEFEVSGIRVARNDSPQGT